MGDIRYTRHARDKFEILERHGFKLTPSQIEDTLLHPEDASTPEVVAWQHVA